LRSSIWEKAHSGFYDIKGAIECLFDLLRLREYSFKRDGTPPEPYLNPVKSCSIVANGEVIGSIGELHPSVASLYELRGEISILEINDLMSLIRAIPSRITYRQLPRFPYIERDISILVDRDVPVAEIEGIISSLNSDIIESVRLFDIYMGKQIPPEKKSIAFTIRYRSSERTLTDNEVDELHSRLIDTLRHTIKAELRS